MLLSFADVAVAIWTRWTSNDYWQAWSLRFLSNAASAVIIVPPILAAVHAYRTWQRVSPRRLAEACLLALCVGALGSLAVLAGASFTRGLPLLFCAYLPLLLWGAMRFGQSGASWTLLGLATATMGSIAQWPAGFAGQTEILMQQAIFRKRIEEELRTLRHELTHLTRVGMLGELSGALAHEINQPLAAILSNGQAAQRMLKHNPHELAEVQDALGDIVDAAKRAGNVIHGLRDMLKKGEPQFRPLDINTVVAEVLDLAHSDLIAHQVAVVRKFASPIPLVRGDRIQLQQVLLNFIMNACEAMSATVVNGRVLTVMTASQDDQSVEISVVDTGKGISPEVQTRLFEAFATTKKNGLGLGLQAKLT